MQISMYPASVPVLSRPLANLDHIPDKGASHAAASKLDPGVLPARRLAPDTFPLVRQAQIGTDLAKGCASRLAGRTPAAYEDKDQTFAELRARIGTTPVHLRGFGPTDIDGSETRVIEREAGGQPSSSTAIGHLFHFVLPNVFFHAITGGAILRPRGVELGKRDFLGAS